MVRSKFLELLDEVIAIPKGAKGAFSMDGLMNMMKTRSTFVEKVEKAFKSGELTAEQRDQLIDLNRKHTLPR